MLSSDVTIMSFNCFRIMVLLSPRGQRSLSGEFLMTGIVVQAILNCTIFGIRILHYSDSYTEAPLILMISHTIRFFLYDV